ncbi:sensor histidine kinase [Smaragdicoccus niigatensis]|uniref:sensor histidine kinase n=1 Tax=Smaragdicoccus niigatensis TaxID=359359 RepID=UPI0012DE811F|nr:ATP-binding protein [Smaragdicoccus niigatensis]
MVRPVPGLVQAGIRQQSDIVALVMRNAAFLLVSLVYLSQSGRTVTGVVLFGLTVVWSVWRLRRRDLSARYLVCDVAIVVVAALLEFAIVPATVADITQSVTRVLAYPVVVSVAISRQKRWSFAVMAAVTVSSAVGDQLLFGAPSSTVMIFALNWWAATWIRRMVLKAAAASDTADAEARRAQLRERVAVARIRYEREQFATLHDTAASTLLMVANAGRLDPERLATQAARDVAVLTDSSNIVGSDLEVDLVAGLERVGAECRTLVTVRSSGPVVVSPLIAGSVMAAVREALNNVDRHAFATSVQVDVTPDLVTVTDDGIGFDPTEPRLGFGLRFSIEERMRRANGSAEISSSPGAGTTVSLGWVAPSVEVEASSPTDVGRVLRSFQYGLAFAQVLLLIQLVLIVFGVDGIKWGLSTVTAAMLFGTWVVVTLLVRERFMFLRWLWVVLLAVLDHWYLVTLPTSDFLSPQNWVTNAVGWAVVAVLCGWVGSWRRVWIGTAILGAMWVIDTVIMVWRDPSGPVIEWAGYNLAAIASMQFAGLFCGWLLAEAVHRADDLGRGQHAAETRFAVEQALQQDYRKRFERLTTEVIVLLRGLADRSLQAGDVRVQERAQAEYSRLRRLFAQADSFEHPLMQRLRPVFDAAADRGVDVTFDVQSRPPDLADQDIEPIAAAIDHLVEGSNNRVRLVVSSSQETVTVSVVSDSTDNVRALVRDALADGEFQLTVADTVTWLRVHLPVPIAA